LIGLPAQHVVEDLAPQFEKATGHKLVVTYSGAQDTRKRMAANEVFDLMLAARQDIDAFVKDGRLAGDTAVDLMKAQIGLAVKAGAPKPALTEAGVKEALLKAKTVGYSTGTSGEYLQKTLFPKLGIADQLKEKLKQVPSGSSVGVLLASGEAEIGMQQVSELIHFKGIDYVGPLPESMQLTTVYSAALFAKADQPQAAKDFIRLLASPQATAAIKDAGLTP
jgi:molybdate transport system substrate-binding protein